jgi:hypothetical protein
MNIILNNLKNLKLVKLLLSRANVLILITYLTRNYRFKILQDFNKRNPINNLDLYYSTSLDSISNKKILFLNVVQIID